MVGRRAELFLVLKFITFTGLEASSHDETRWEVKGRGSIDCELACLVWECWVLD